MKITLVYPPVYEPLQPMVSLGYLKSFLELNGYLKVTQKDVSMEAFDYFLTPEILETVYEERVRKKRIHQKEKALEIINNINEAKNILRSRELFFDREKYAGAIKTVEAALELISQGYYPTKWSSPDFRMRYSRASSKEVLKALNNKEENCFIEYFENNTVPEIINLKPDIIGISITSKPQLIPGLTLANYLKKAVPDVHITVGGALITKVSDAFGKNHPFWKFCNSFVAYEGEHALLSLTKYVEAGEEIPEKCNLLLKDSRRRITETTRFIENLNQLPTPCFEGLPLDLYLSPMPVLPLAVSRGCYYKKCVFCAYGASKGTCASYRMRAPELITKDIKKLSKKYKTKFFQFSVDVVSIKDLVNLSKALLKKGLKVKWDCDVRLENNFTREKTKLLKKAGCCAICFGLESGSQRILNLMNKGIEIKYARQILKACKDSGISTNVMTFSRFPGETIQEENETLSFMMRNKDVIDFAAFNKFVLLKGSMLEFFPEVFGITKIHKKVDEDLTLEFDFELEQSLQRKDSTQSYEKSLSLFHKYYHQQDESQSWANAIATSHNLLYIDKYGGSGCKKSSKEQTK